MTTLSQPAELIRICVAVLLLLVYVTPSIQVRLSQAVTTSVPELELLIVKANVTTLSQPAALVKV